MEPLEKVVKSILNLSEEAWQMFASCFSSERLSKGDYFALEGRREKHIGFLTSGVVRAFFRTNDGVEYNKTFFVPGDFFGPYSALVSGKPNRIFIQALTDVDFYKADYAAITALYVKHREIESLSRLLAEQFFIEKENREIELVLLQADERYRIFQQEYPGVEIQIPQYHIASYLGITPTQLSRIRAKR
jgi:CRP-like cAMP-binding protein